MSKPFHEFPLSDFWEDSDYAREQYVDDPLTDEKVAAVEMSFGYKLPIAYITLARLQNGGIPKRSSHRMHMRTSWAEDHIAISGIYSIGHIKPCSLLGSFGSKFWCIEWGYPPIGIYFADCPSAGHDMLCLDYRACGPNGEPRVVHVDREFDYTISRVADNFDAFISGLTSHDDFE